MAIGRWRRNLLDVVLALAVRRLIDGAGAVRETAAADDVVDVADGGEDDGEGEDADTDGEAGAVLWSVLLAEDLGAVDAGNVGSHDDPEMDLLVERF